MFQIHKKIFLLFCCLALNSCHLSSPMMTASAFEQIPIGASVSEIEVQVGEPYSIQLNQKGMQQYCYIERIETGPGGRTSQNTYILTIKDGIVIDKQRLNESKSFNFQFH